MVPELPQDQVARNLRSNFISAQIRNWKKQKISKKSLKNWMIKFRLFLVNLISVNGVFQKNPSVCKAL
ncbi:phage integrase N-terminal domain-containing protein [Zobellia amurskyensis]|uniref:phage integrase N-terminal domain-containing protein n=1 Tax=Zobellia amurskyensis TaxID=248905 RepID=UPI003B848437